MNRFNRLTLFCVVAAGLAFAMPAFAQGSGKPLAQTVDLSGMHFTVGSKEFTEQLILGKMTVELLKAAGADVTDETGLAGSVTARDALTSGKIDMYWEYTGTAWVVYLGHTTTKIHGRLYKKVAKEDLEKNGIKWLKPTDLNDSYAIFTNSETAKKYDVKTFSDYARLLKNHPEEGAICVGNEFANRPDGLLGLEKTYGWKLPPSSVVVVQESLTYSQAAKGSRCNFGDGTTTDGRIAALNLVLLEDNKHFFPPYYVALTMRDKTFKKYPQLAKLFGPLSKVLTTKAMTSLNEAVDVKGGFPAQVAHKFLVKHGFIAG